MATISKDFVKTLRPEIDAALAAIAKAHGLASLRGGNCSFDPIAGTFTLKVEGLAANALGKDASRYVQTHEMLGLPVRGTEFTANGIAYKTDGISSTGAKVTIVRLSDEKKFLMNTDFVVLACKRDVKVVA